VVLSSERPLSDCPEVATLVRDGRATYVTADLTKPGEPERLVAAAWDALGGLDVLVNNVGTFREPAFPQLTRSDFDFVFGLNVWAGLAATQEFVRRGRVAGTGGRIIFTTSLNGSRSEPAHTLYDSSKGAVNALTRQLAIELAPHGFTTVAVAPGFVETPLTDMGLRSDPAARRAVEEQIPVRRIATVDDLAMWYVFLASDSASYATGTIVTVDGGLDAQQMPTRPITTAERHR
jgi:NAD(P)-dependent dehydrogenase (short-subunit alcohol dehydrogenase family)